jgi:pimeloyl-ACP methyl ester carboxylesterase
MALDLLGTANKALRAVLVARGAVSESTDIGGTQIHHYRVEGAGKGPPLVLLHGLGGSANSFYKTMFQLQPHFRGVFAPDLPGNGFSPLPKGGALPLEEQVRVFLDYLDQVVKEPVFLVGNSLGGAMAVASAWLKPKQFKGLGLVSPAGAKVSPERMGALVESFEVKDVKAARALTKRLFHRAPIPLMVFAGELKRLYGSEAVKRVLAAGRPADFLSEETLAGLSMPTLLVWGKSEKLLPYEGIEYFRKHLPPHAEVHEVPGFGHLPQLERPDALVKLLLSFARRHGLT